MYALGLIVIAILYSSAASAAEAAESMVCERRGITRIVELRIHDPSGVPCDVLYLKPDEGGIKQRLWHANTDANFCKIRYHFFIEKLENKLAWSCQPGSLGAGARAESMESNQIKEPLTKPKPIISIADPALVAEDLKASTLEAKSLIPEDKDKPLLATALPIGQAKFTQPGTADQEVISALSMVTVKQYFQNGFYDAAPSNANEVDSDACPEGGYFVWNTRDRARPVYEMGRTFEFAIDLGNLSEGGLVDSPYERSDETLICSTSIKYSACQYPDFREGADTWDLNDQTFRCDTRQTNHEQRSDRIALFQSRQIDSSSSSACADNPQIYHIGIAPLQSDDVAPSESQQQGIELAIWLNESTAGNSEDLTLKRCKYLRR